MIVVDASAVLEALLNTAAGARVRKRLRAPGESAHAPHLLDLEVAQVLRRHCFRGEISPERGAVALRDLTELRVTRYPHALLLPRIWELSDNLTAYDAAYVALAEVLAAPLVTCDEGLAASSGHGADIELI